MIVILNMLDIILDVYICAMSIHMNALYNNDSFDVNIFIYQSSDFLLVKKIMRKINLIWNLHSNQYMLTIFNIVILLPKYFLLILK